MEPNNLEQKLPKFERQLQEIFVTLDTAYKMLIPIGKFLQSTPGHASQTYGTFCLLVGDIKKQVDTLYDETTE